MTDEQWGAAVRLLWGPPAKPARGPKRGLTLERIARAGVGIADPEGLGGVSMQRVAGELAVTKMALYRYVPGKAELVSLMVESAIPDPGVVDAAWAEVAEAEGWRGRLRVWARELLAGFRGHPWLLEATVGARVMGPRELGWMERALAALDGCGLTGAEAMDAVVLLTGHVRGIAEQERAAGGGAGAGAAGPDAQLVAVMGELMRTHGEQFPALGAALASVAEHGGQDQALEFGLERILDGLGLLVARRVGGADR
ncbi:TetR/AcrR family transcriptional regulator [Streptomyces sp. NBC_00162]|uniref:TetR/AcrR family transcriptional regulator n=1 Tax=Streptomyces sp. NBC_00162 TaxID=2903629 RepID=UPI00214C8FD1|nr:TetR/AcrR family transcriptional regulator C-terminal domain-containing protein [Streptomyces sp. NBC_00162]UUU44963.1 TetR/AcrR family transcriptional regulator C-terminal domain-containing protein [Streptomyces sp. NBC_00162]